MRTTCTCIAVLWAHATDRGCRILKIAFRHLSNRTNDRAVSTRRHFTAEDVGYLTPPVTQRQRRCCAVSETVLSVGNTPSVVSNTPGSAQYREKSSKAVG